MKKSFLITLAAVSSVALIGCSSSSDDNKSEEKTPVAPNAVAEKVAADSTYYVYKITNAEKLNIKAVCDEKTDATNLVVDQAQDLVGYKKSEATSDVECTVSLDGEGSTSITFNAANNETTKEIVSITPAGTVESNGNDIVVPADNKGHKVTFATKAAPTYNSTEANKLEKKEGAEGTKFIVLAAEGLAEGVAEIPADCQATTGKGKASCDVTLKSADKAAAGKITATAKTDGEVEAKTTNVSFKEAGSSESKDPEVTVDLTTLQPHAADSTLVKIPLIVGNATDTQITSIECTYNNGAKAAGDCTDAGELGFVKGTTDNGGTNVFFVNTEKLLALEENKSFTITVNNKDAGIKALTVDKALVDQLASKYIVKRFTVALASKPTQAIDKLEVSDHENGQEIIITATDKHFVSYKTATKDPEAEFNKPGKAATDPLKFHTVAIKKGTGDKFGDLVETGVTENKKCSKLNAKTAAGTTCNTKVKLAAQNEGALVNDAGITVKVGEGEAEQVLQLIKPAVSK